MGQGKDGCRCRPGGNSNLQVTPPHSARSLPAGHQLRLFLGPGQLNPPAPPMPSSGVSLSVHRKRAGSETDAKVSAVVALTHCFSTHSLKAAWFFVAKAGCSAGAVMFSGIPAAPQQMMGTPLASSQDTVRCSSGIVRLSRMDSCMPRPHTGSSAQAETQARQGYTA